MNYIISFPRSGQHLIESILRYIYFKLNKEFTYCEYYSCCNQLGSCKNNSIFQKNHDFWLNDKTNGYNKNRININENEKYLILYRKDKIKQLEAYYRFSVKASRRNNYNYNDLISFINGNSSYYDNFVNKWVNNNYNNVLKVEYYDFIDDPTFFIKKIYYHFNDSILIDEDIFNIKSIRLSVDNGFRKKEAHDTIKAINNIDIELYNKIKRELGW